jgi:hypothetical protein
MAEHKVGQSCSSLGSHETEKDGERKPMRFTLQRHIPSDLLPPTRPCNYELVHDEVSAIVTQLPLNSVTN